MAHDFRRQKLQFDETCKMLRVIPEGDVFDEAGRTQHNQLPMSGSAKTFLIQKDPYLPGIIRTLERHVYRQ